MVETDECGDVWRHGGPLIVMDHAFAELRDGVVARQHEDKVIFAALPTARYTLWHGVPS